MPVPAEATPADRQLRGDGWSQQITLDPAQSWAGSTFTVTTVPPAPITVDASHRADAAPYVVLSLTAAQTADLRGSSFRWYLAEDKVLSRTFLARTVEVVDL